MFQAGVAIRQMIPPSPPVPVTLLVISAAIMAIGIVVYLARRLFKHH